MGPRNLLILFFSTVAVSLVILVIFFSLFFKNIDLNFNTKLPQSAPDIGGMYDSGKGMSPDSKADGLLRSTVNVPPEIREPEPEHRPAEAAKKPESEPADHALPPVSDDVILQEGPVMGAPVPSSAAPPATAHSRPEPATPKATPVAPSATERPRPKPRPAPEPEAPPPIEDASPSGPPVPGQG
jgi:hypothetical protein